MHTIVVTGVAGSLGRRVAARLLEPGAGERVIGIDSTDASLPAPEVDGRGLELHRLQVRRFDLAADGLGADSDLVALLHGADCVVHLAWRTSDTAGGPSPDTEREVAESNRVALARVLAAADKAGVPGLVHLSSATVYGAWADNRIPMTEDSPLRPNPEFGFAVGKAEAERVVAEWAGAHPDVAVAVLRPAVTVGSPERPLYLALGGTRVPGADDGGRPVQFLHVDDLADAVIVAARAGLRGVYNVAPDAGIPERMARSLAGGVARLTLPARLTRPLAAWGWDLWRRGVPREARAYTVHPWVIAPDRLKAAGWSPQHTSEEALVATDDRPHFDDLPPGRRQNLTLLLVAAGVGGAASAGIGGVLAVRARRRKR